MLCAVEDTVQPEHVPLWLKDVRAGEGAGPMKSDPSSSDQLRGYSLVLARMLWAVLALGYLALWLASLPNYYDRVSTLAIEPVLYGERISFDNDTARQQASGRGLSLPAYALYDIGYSALQVLIYYAVAVTILWRTSSRFGWFTALILMLMPVPALEQAVRAADLFPAASLLVLFQAI
jgi:hypothetical protein